MTGRGRRLRLFSTGSPRARRNAGRTMIAVAAIGFAVALIGTVVGWQLVGEVDDASTDALDVTIESLRTVDDTIDLADDLIDSTVDTVSGVTTGLDTLASSLDAGGELLTDTSDFTGSAGPVFDNAVQTLGTLEQVAATVDDLLTGLSRIPLAPQYDPEASLSATIGSLADDLEPLTTRLEDASVSLDSASESLDELVAEVRAVTTDIGSIERDLARTDQLIDGYRANVADAREAALNARTDLNTDVGQMRLLIVVAGLNFAVGQLVPLWLGLELIGGGGSRQAAGSRNRDV